MGRSLRSSCWRGRGCPSWAQQIPAGSKVPTTGFFCAPPPRSSCCQESVFHKVPNTTVLNGEKQQYEQQGGSSRNGGRCSRHQSMVSLQPLEKVSREQWKGDGAAQESCESCPTLTTVPVLTLCAAQDWGKGSGAGNEGVKLNLKNKGGRWWEGVLIFALNFSPSNTVTNWK